MTMESQQEGTGSAAAPGMRPEVSYVVLCHNSARYIEKCVRSLAAGRTRSGGGVPDEIWVVDNGSTDPTPQLLTALQREHPQVRVIRAPRNLGTTVSRNLALRQATGRFIAIVDSDVEVPPGTLDALIETLRRHPGCGILAPRLEYPDGRLQLSTDVFPTLQRKLQRYLLLRQMEGQLRVDPGETVRPVDYAISAFWLMRRETFTAVGPLDERIFYSPEDVDYCLRVWLAGLRVLYDSSIRVVHDSQEISRTWLPRRATISHALGLVYLFSKHRYWFGLAGVRARIATALARRGHAGAAAFAGSHESTVGPC